MKSQTEILLKQVKVIDPNSPYHNKKVDILVDNGVIKKISNKINSTKDQKLIEFDKSFVCPGLMDMSVDFQEPGNEQKETINSGVKAAAAGGFTSVVLQPTLEPSRDKLSDIVYCKEKKHQFPVDIFPIGAISKNNNGEELAEMYDMHSAGAIAFSDYKKPIHKSGLLSRALLYVKNFNGLIISHPYDDSICTDGQMHEGVTSTSMGLPGIPSLAEELYINRDIALTNYNESKIHFNIISSKESVQKIADSKNDKINLSCGTSIYHLIFNDEDLKGFNSNFKMIPPLRTKEDQFALITGIKEGVIDVITSNHQPHENEIREVEFPLAPFGCIGTQIAFPMALTYLKDELGLETIVKCMSINPRSILQTDIPVIEEGFLANLTVFDTHTNWEFNKENNFSLSENSPIINTKLTGKVHGTILGNMSNFST